jgi:hypothetical protein
MLGVPIVLSGNTRLSEVMHLKLEGDWQCSVELMWQEIASLYTSLNLGWHGHIHVSFVITQEWEMLHKDPWVSSQMLQNKKWPIFVRMQWVCNWSLTGEMEFSKEVLKTQVALSTLEALMSKREIC